MAVDCTSSWWDSQLERKVTGKNLGEPTLQEKPGVLEKETCEARSKGIIGGNTPATGKILNSANGGRLPDVKKTEEEEASGEPTPSCRLSGQFSQRGKTCR